MGVSYVPTNVNTWALKIPPSQKSRYLGTCVLERYIQMHTYPKTPTFENCMISVNFYLVYPFRKRTFCQK